MLYAALYDSDYCHLPMIKSKQAGHSKVRGFDYGVTVRAKV